VSSGFRPHFLAREDSGAATCNMAPDPSSLLGRAPVSSRALRLRTVSPCREGSGATTHPMVPYRLWTSSIKKNLPSLVMQLSSRVSKVHMHVSKSPDARVIMGLQDVRTSCVFNACKMSGQTATVCYSAASILLTTRKTSL
jgi:hypothetical protein